MTDDKLVGTWQSSTGAKVWIFEKDGTYSARQAVWGSSEIMSMEGYYRAENGMLKLSFSKKVENYIVARYEYQFGFTESGKECLFLDGELFFRV